MSNWLPSEAKGPVRSEVEGHPSPSSALSGGSQSRSRRACPRIVAKGQKIRDFPRSPASYPNPLSSTISNHLDKLLVVPGYNRKIIKIDILKRPIYRPQGVDSSPTIDIVGDLPCGPAA